MTNRHNSRLARFQKSFSSFGQALRSFGDESGVTAIEYALLASLIAMVALAGITTLGGEVFRLWNAVADKVGAAM